MRRGLGEDFQWEPRTGLGKIMAFVWDREDIGQRKWK